MSEVLASDEMEPPSVTQRLIEGIPYGAHNLTGSRRAEYMEAVRRHIGESVIAHVYDAYFIIPEGSASSLAWWQVEVAQQNLAGTLGESAEADELVFDADGCEFTQSATGIVVRDGQRQVFIPLQFLKALYSTQQP